jgi:alpha,alpha-trehalose phosphorylase
MWKVINEALTKEELLNNESIFAVGNGYLGVRGNFEEGYGNGFPTIRGTYINGFYDITKIEYGEKLHGFPEQQQKMLNVIDSQTIEIYLEDERFNLFDGEILSFKRVLHLNLGYVERTVHWRSPKGKEVKISFRRFVSFDVKELFLIDVRIEPVNFHGKITVVSKIKGDVSNYVDPNDPRISGKDEKHLFVKENNARDNLLYMVCQTGTSNLQTACIVNHLSSLKPLKEEITNADEEMQVQLTFSLESSFHFSKWSVYTDTLRHGEDVLEKGMAIHHALANKSVEDMLNLQREYLRPFWRDADILINGDARLQEGIRFNLYQLLQSVGKDVYSNIAAKGLTGEGYEGHYFWDTEIYIFPVFLLTNRSIAKNLLLYRYSKLADAKEHARTMGHKQGALYPWRTISGTECSGYYPSGSAQYHISADIAYSYVQYYLATGDKEFLRDYGMEVLIETARLWKEIGHFQDGKFHIDAVTGPDEYTCIVNNNFYTNVMAKYNLTWAAKAFEMVRDFEQHSWEELCNRLNITEDEVNQFIHIANSMYLPYDENLGINPQDDTFLNKAVWDFDNTPKSHYPLLLHYHPLTLYRYQVCKQADTVLAHFLVEEEVDYETIKKSYDYYEKVTTHDSSLSSCIFSMMAAKLGYYEKAIHYFEETARMDLDNTHGNTKDGLHMANMGGTWMSIVYGFAGFRLKEEGISFQPFIPENWESYSFKINYRNCQLQVAVSQLSVEIQLLKGEELELKLYGSQVKLKAGCKKLVPVQKRNGSNE